MSDRGVQSCDSRLHLSTLFLGSRRAGSDSTFSWSANTSFSMKLKSMITTSFFHLFLVWHVEPKARRKQVGQHGFHQGACQAVSLFRVWAVVWLPERRRNLATGLRGSKAFGNSVWQARSEAVGNLVHSSKFFPRAFLYRASNLGVLKTTNSSVRLVGPFKRFWSFPTSGTFRSHVRVASWSRPSGNFPTSGCSASKVCSASWRQGMGWVDDMSELEFSSSSLPG